MVLHPRYASTVDPAGRLAGDLSAVQEAFAAYDRGADEAVVEALRPLGLKSPFRYWKLLMRGLIAFYGGDEETAAKSFQRIPNGLPVADLAADFLAVLSSRGMATPARRGGREAGNADSLAAHATDLQRAMAWGDTTRGLRILQALIGVFPDEPRVHRIAAAFCWHSQPLTRHRFEGRAWSSFKRALGPFIFDDLEFARTVALNAERAGAWEDSLSAWGDFAGSLATGEIAPPAGLPQNRVLAQIHLRMAHNMSKELIEVVRNPFYFGRIPTAEALESVDGFLERAGSLDPTSPEPYLAGVSLARDDWEDVDHAFRWAERLVKVFPDHLEGLLAAADLGLKRGVYRKALGFVKRAEALEPLHNDVREKRSLCLLLSARKRASDLKYDLARRDYVEALSSVTGDRAAKVKVELGCLEAALDQVEVGRDWIDQGVQALGGGVGPLFRVVVESKMKRSDPAIGRQYLASLKERLSTREPQHAIELAGVFREYEQSDYPGKDGDRTLVVAHVKRCAKGGFSREDAFTLCQFLADAREYRTLVTLAGRSVTAHPDDFHFPVFQTLAKAKTRPHQLRWKDEELLQTCRRRASEAGEERFARFADEVLTAVAPWTWEEDEDDQWDEPPAPFGVPPEILEAIDDVLGGRRRASGRKARKGKEGDVTAPVAGDERPAATQLDLFGDDE
jgi:tetratricopeptide (TPR) repeat protein